MSGQGAATASEAEVALAFVSRREGRRRMPAARWSHVISLGLGWMAPSEARLFVERAATAALLRADGGELELAFDPARINIPIGFRPSPAAAAEAATPPPMPPASAPPAPDTFLDWVGRLSAHQQVARPQVMEQVAAVQARMGGALSALAALLWLCQQAGLDVREAASGVKP